MGAQTSTHKINVNNQQTKLDSKLIDTVCPKCNTNTLTKENIVYYYKCDCGMCKDCYNSLDEPKACDHGSTIK